MKKMLLAVGLLSSLITGCSKSKKTELTILAAASLTDVCAQLKNEYEKENSDVKLLFSFGGSGALQAQIEAGAPCDLFISAATKQMKALVEKNLMEEGSVSNLLENKVVLILPKDSSLKLSSFEDLTLPEVKMIAIGEPDSVPAGQYTKAICQKLGSWESVSKKANFASDVRTVLSWVEEAACDCGLVYATDAAVSQKIRVVAEAPEGSCPPVIYPVGIVENSRHKETAQKFEAFLYSDKAKAIFEKAGFVTLKK
ncbi:molybdate ABC transporter substrate-binding protein [Treponema sp. C6A8]|uniref:molybdate ABC transporter substrate-binding protein n=1 Tax=Treponema sp. C6A8 TaxID=1410609 RepID=UPI000485E4A3|nr:molybdate ABC transporter substrate-binding protein [Treponema sp. C6A8]